MTATVCLSKHLSLSKEPIPRTLKIYLDLTLFFILMVMMIIFMRKL